MTGEHPTSPAGHVNAAGIAGYRYCMPSFECGSRILFQGDSITDMNWGRNEDDRNHYLGHSYVYLIAARLGVDMPEAKLQFFTRGHSGNTLQDLKGRWQEDAIDLLPDVLSILIGTNDVGRAATRGVDLGCWENDYRHILDASREANPELRLVLLDPFVLPTGDLANPDVWAWRRDGVEKLNRVIASLALDYKAAHIKTQDIFDFAAAAAGPEQWMWDGIHPLPQGHELIARHWLEVVSAR